MRLFSKKKRFSFHFDEIPCKRREKKKKREKMEVKCKDDVCQKVPVPEEPSESMEGKPLMEIPLLNEKEEKVEFGEICKGRNALVVFTRHAG